MKATKEYEQSQQMIEFIRENSVRKRGKKMLNEEAGDDNGEDIIAITN